MAPLYITLQKKNTTKEKKKTENLPTLKSNNQLDRKTMSMTEKKLETKTEKRIIKGWLKGCEPPLQSEGESKRG